MRNLKWQPRMDRVYAKGHLRPRRKGERKHPYEQFPDFPNQKGKTGEFELKPNNIVRVKFLGMFRGYSSWGQPVWYRAFQVMLVGGKIVAGYSNNGDGYVLCLNTQYVAA